MNLFEECALMGRLQIDLAREFAQAPKPISPSETLPDQEDGMDWSEYNREHDRYAER